MRTLAEALLLVLAFLLLVEGSAAFVPSVWAIPHPPPTPVIDIQSPGWVVNVPNPQLVVTAKVPSYGSSGGFEGIKLLQYSLDGQNVVQLTLESQGEIKTAIKDTTNPFNGDPYILYVARATLWGLSDGAHFLAVDGKSLFDKELHRIAYFTVDTVHPNLNVLSPQRDSTYTSPSVALNYFVNEQISWAGYKLDGGDLVTSRINTTLTNLSYRTHVIQVYANDTEGNIGASQTFDFTATDEPQESAHFPTIVFAAALVSVAAFVAVALLVYVKKRKREAEHS